MAKAKKIGHVPKKAASVAVASPRQKPKPIIIVASCFALMTLILFAYAYCMTSEYVFNDTLNYGAVNSLKDKSTFWLKLLMSGVSAPLAEPWLKATYAWDSGSFGFSPGWSHAVNICLHVLSCIYFYLFSFRIAWRMNLDGKSKIDPYYIAFAATALLAFHPLATGSIAYISGREGVLGAVNYFLAINLFLYGFYEERLGHALGAYALFFLFAAIGILSNVQCLTVPFFAAGLICILKPPVVPTREWFIERSYELISLLLVGCAVLYLITHGMPAKIDSSFGLVSLAPAIYWATQFKMLVMYYLRCALIPFGLSVYPPYVASQGFADPATIAGAVSLVAIATAAFIQKQPLVKAGILLFVLTLFPWLVFPQGEISADYRFYLPLAGLCLIAGTGVAHLAGKDFRKTAIGFSMVVLTLISLTVWRETEWSNDKRLWRAEIKRTDNARAHAYLAAYLLEHDKQDACKAELRKALALQNDDFVAHIVNSYYFFRLKDYKQASSELEMAIALGEKCKMSAEDLSPYRAQLAKALAMANNLPDAYKQATLASQFITTDPFLYLLNGKALIEEHQPLRALKVLEDGIKLQPNNSDFLVPIAQAALDSGMPQVIQHAYAASAKAVRVRPGLDASKLFIRACLEYGKPQEAAQLLESLRKTNPNDAEIVWLASAYAKAAGKADEAEKLRKQALSMDPTIEKRNRLFMRNKPQLLEPPKVVTP